MKSWKILLLITTVMFIADIAFGQGCSQCKLIAEQASGNGLDVMDEASFGTNLNYGILFLMALPYIILFIFFRKRIVGLFRGLTEKSQSK